MDAFHNYVIPENSLNNKYVLLQVFLRVFDLFHCLLFYQLYWTSSLVPLQDGELPQHGMGISLGCNILMTSIGILVATRRVGTLSSMDTCSSGGRYNILGQWICAKNDEHQNGKGFFGLKQAKSRLKVIYRPSNCIK